MTRRISEHKKLFSRLGLLIMIIFISVVAFNIGGFVKQGKLLQDASCLRLSDKNYSLIKPLLACDTLRDFEAVKYRPLKEEFETEISQAKAETGVTEAGVYFRTPENGQWTGVNPDAYFHPASLLKVANLMSVLKEEDLGHHILEKTYTVNPAEVVATEQNVPPEKTIQDHVTYTVEELLKYLIVYSDNRVNRALNVLADLNVLNALYSDFNLNTHKEGEGSYELSPRSYSLLFRALYNATYLSKPLSEKALSLLTQTDYVDGLVAGLPENTVVAHKFGNDVRKDDSGKTIQELHDCGIVYRKEGDYVICIMTRGTDLKKMEVLISALSSTAYHFAVK